MYKEMIMTIAFNEMETYIYVSGNKQNQALSLFPRQLVND